MRGRAAALRSRARKAFWRKGRLEGYMGRWGAGDASCTGVQGARALQRQARSRPAPNPLTPHPRPEASCEHPTPISEAYFCAPSLPNSEPEAKLSWAPLNLSPRQPWHWRRLLVLVTALCCGAGTCSTVRIGQRSLGARGSCTWHSETRKRRVRRCAAPGASPTL